MKRHRFALTALVIALMAIGCGDARAGEYLVSQMVPGDCLDLDESMLVPDIDRPVPILSCEEPHDYEVYFAFEAVGDDDPLSGRGRLLPQPPAWSVEAVDRCEAEFPFGDRADLAWTVLYHSSESRADVVCVVLDSRRRPLVGSLIDG